MSKVTIDELKPVMEIKISRETQLMKDGASMYKSIGKDMASRGKPPRWWKRDRENPEINTNSVEN